MKRQAWFIMSAIVILLIIFGTVIVKNGVSTGKVVLEEEEITNGASEINSDTEPPKTGEIEPVTVNVKIINFAFAENTIEINAGDTVVWENRDSVGHTVTSNDGVEMNSRLLMKGEKYSHTFNKVGEYDYYCIPHPYMTGKVVVN